MYTKKTFFKNYKDNFVVLSIAIILGTIAFITFGRHVDEIISYRKCFSDLIYKFTSESNILVLGVMIAFFTPLRKSSSFTYLAFIALISISFTSIVNHTILDRDEIKGFNFKDAIHYRHTIIPLFYVIFYFLSKEIYALSLKKVYMGLIHPLLYFCFFLIKGLIVGKSYVYPYGFIDPYRPGIFKIKEIQGYRFLLLMVLVLTISLYLYSSLLTYIKKKY
ncbi:Pr6Pr family membrane protein [Candidatus Phytoplasma solani]|uniref:Pr6Pr family membrane protein n=1 Tax=Candidatus Phytoplasma solani TaxID=69896 RepID=UPI00358FC3CD